MLFTFTTESASTVISRRAVSAANADALNSTSAATHERSSQRPASPAPQ
jgi:hypothetical protein